MIINHQFSHEPLEEAESPPGAFMHHICRSSLQEEQMRPEACTGDARGQSNTAFGFHNIKVYFVNIIPMLQKELDKLEVKNGTDANKSKRKNGQVIEEV